MKQFVVYTVQVGGYDEVRQPTVVDDRFDYVLFTDEISSQTAGVWQLKPIPYSNSDKKRVSCFVKMHPEELLADYDASLFMDGNIQITSHAIYDKVVELYN